MYLSTFRLLSQHCRADHSQGIVCRADHSQGIVCRADHSKGIVPPTFQLSIDTHLALTFPITLTVSFGTSTTRLVSAAPQG